MSKMTGIRSVKELRLLLEQAIRPSFCRFATQDDYITSLQEVQELVDELRNIKELKDE